MAITGWREFPAFVGGRRAAKVGKGRELSGGNYRASGGGAWPSGLRARSSTRRWRRWPGRPRTRARPARARSGQVGQPGGEQPTGWRSQNQADDDEGQCHREFVPTALPRCWLAGQSGHAGHGVRWMAGDSLSAKVNSPPTCGR